MDDFHFLRMLRPILIGILFITVISLFKEPNRRQFMAIMLAGAGAAYLNAGLGIWEFAFTAVVTYCAYQDSSLELVKQ